MTRLVFQLSLLSLANLGACSSADPFAVPDRSGCTRTWTSDVNFDGEVDEKTVTLYGPDEVVMRREATDLRTGDSTVTEVGADDNACVVWYEKNVAYGAGGTKKVRRDTTCDGLGNPVSARQAQWTHDASGQETSRRDFTATFTNEYDDKDQLVSKHTVWIREADGQEVTNETYTWSYDAQGRQNGGSKFTGDDLEYDYQREWRTDTYKSWESYFYPTGEEFYYKAEFDEHDRPLQKSWTGDYREPSTDEWSWSDTRFAIDSIRYDTMDDGEVDLVATFDCEEGVPVMACTIAYDGKVFSADAMPDGDINGTEEWRYTCP